MSDLKEIHQKIIDFRNERDWALSVLQTGYESMYWTGSISCYIEGV